jgi:hypothetical protein
MKEVRPVIANGPSVRLEEEKTAEENAGDRLVGN